MVACQPLLSANFHTFVIDILEPIFIQNGTINGMLVNFSPETCKEDVTLNSVF